MLYACAVDVLCVSLQLMTSEEYPTVILTVLRTTLETRIIHLKKKYVQLSKKAMLRKPISIMYQGAKETDKANRGSTVRGETRGKYAGRGVRRRQQA